MSDWFREYILDPAEEWGSRKINQIESYGSAAIRRVWDAEKRLLEVFHVAGSAGAHKISATAQKGLGAVDRGVNEGLKRVEGAGATVLQNVEKAGSKVIDNLETGTANAARTFKRHVVDPAEHAIAQPIQNAWHGAQHLAGQAWDETKYLGGQYIHFVERTTKIVVYGGMLIAGYMFYRVLQDQREEQMIKRRRYR